MKNLIRIYSGADKSGMYWYNDANIFACRVAEKYNLSLPVVSAVLSALSPGTNWEQNKKDTINLIEAAQGNKREFKFTTYGQNVIKAYRILDEKASPETFFSLKTGAKTFNFFYNVWQPENPEFVTIDRHAYVIATGLDYSGLTPKQYSEVATHYKKAAAKLNVLPSQLQAILWTDYRTKQEIKFTEFCPF
jgi:hypothetical protein